MHTRAVDGTGPENVRLGREAEGAQGAEADTDLRAPKIVWGGELHFLTQDKQDGCAEQGAIVPVA